ncbi:hypothetical protein IAT38_004069 [Cryptococcus sp. DSM 104549]
MEFLPQSHNHPTPKNLYPCLATITISQSSNDTKSQRRLSAGSFGSDANKEDGNPLQRVISGGRRKSSFGDAAGSGGGRRLSFGGNKEEESKAQEGRWFWRVQAGVNDTHLILLPLTQPANPLLTSPPAPLSAAIPSHASGGAARTGASTTATHGANDSAIADEDEGIASKFKNLFRRSSTTAKDVPATSGSGESGGGAAAAASERIVDQDESGNMLPGAKANSAGATNVNANAEVGWPGIVQGEKLGAITVPLGSVEKGKVTLGGGKKGEGSWVIVPISSHFASLVQPIIEPLGSNSKPDAFAKAGTIKFEFDKDWIGAKGEAELLHHYITTAVASAAAPTSGASGARRSGEHSRAPPLTEPFKLGGAVGGGSGAGRGAGANSDAAARQYASEQVAPDESAGSSRSGKIQGE